MADTTTSLVIADETIVSTESIGSELAVSCCARGGVVALKARGALVDIFADRELNDDGSLVIEVARGVFKRAVFLVALLTVDLDADGNVLTLEAHGALAKMLSAGDIVVTANA
jgi:hypothetical protein